MPTAIEEVRKIGAELRERAEQQGATIVELQDKIAEYAKALRAADEEREHLRNQLNDQIARGGRPGAGGNPESFGQRVAASEGYVKKDAGARTRHEGESILVRALSHTSSNVSAVPKDYDTDLARGTRYREISFLALIPRVRTSSNAVPYFRRTKIHSLVTELGAAGTIADTTITLESGDNKPGASGIRVGSKLTIGEGAGAEEVTVQAVTLSTHVVNITALTKNHTKGSQVTSDEFTWTSEMNVKPCASMGIEEVTCNIKTVADIMVLSKQIYEDSELFADEVDMELPLILQRMMEKMVLYGNGTTDEWQGILTDTDVLEYAWSSGKVGDTKLDAIRRAITIAALAERKPDVILLNPKDCEDLELQKSDDKMYVNKLVILPDGTLAVWRLPIVETTSIKANDFLIASFAQGSKFYDREETETRIFEQDVDNVRKNALTLRCEGRVGFALREPEAFVYGQFDAAPS